MTRSIYPRMILKGRNKINPDHLFTYRARKNVKENTGASVDIVELKVDKSGKSMSQYGSIHWVHCKLTNCKPTGPKERIGNNQDDVQGTGEK